ncbi:hypothetical protein CAZ10_09950 [Pseudomonas aeruginosa]|uniref:Uncharacterized protein n=1 Tax=Pseudomonas aeruginosa TaxID=287 RepID=A0A241XST6_PSEAI|nr:hypothetical protein CAZ10_09950 [Pseudomonas aeruginosa]
MQFACLVASQILTALNRVYGEGGSALTHHETILPTQGVSFSFEGFDLVFCSCFGHGSFLQSVVRKDLLQICSSSRARMPHRPALSEATVEFSVKD